jgi:hypothetical protein
VHYQSLAWEEASNTVHVLERAMRLDYPPLGGFVSNGSVGELELLDSVEAAMSVVDCDDVDVLADTSKQPRGRSLPPAAGSGSGKGRVLF